MSGEVTKIMSNVVSGKSSPADAVNALNNGNLKYVKEALTGTLLPVLSDKKVTAETKQAVFQVISGVVAEFGTSGIPHVWEGLIAALRGVSEKKEDVQAAAKAAVDEIIPLCSGETLVKLVPVLLTAMAGKEKWQTKELALTIMQEKAAAYPQYMALQLSPIIPVLSPLLQDSKAQVKQAAAKTTEVLCQHSGNNDIQPLVPQIVKCMSSPEDLHDTIHKLAATTFVQAVEEPAMAILVPVLVRGLKERVTAIIRKSCVIAENMSKLVEDPAQAAPFLPAIMPLVKRASEEVANPECRSVAARALKILQQIEDAVKQRFMPEREFIDKKLGETAGLDDEVAQEFIVDLAVNLILARKFKEDAWKNIVAFGQVANLDSASAQFLEECRKENERIEKENAVVEEEEEGEDLCKCEFSLAYGAKILLNSTYLHLKRGKRYGLCGPNGCGKSTLMRAIANGQVENFPKPDELRTVYVEHDLDSSLAEMQIVDFLASDERFSHIPRDDIEQELRNIGFTDELLEKQIAGLSGGWRMKLALARAILLKADIMLLDEPTNHLDVTNVAWLADYLNSLKEVTSIIVSHDSGFLDKVCTHIIHYETRKLKNYRGNLSAFVKQVPEAASYYELDATPISWKWPVPGFLEGVKSKDRAVLKMQEVAFQYPGTPKPQLTGITLQCSLNSRVACIGGNGAGKSTLIKLLTGELQPTSGTVWKHPNLRVAYVAQHAFHHIEEHLDWTPNQYIQWRYASGEDREEQQKVSRQVLQEEQKKMEEIIKMPDGTKRKVDKLLGRRKGKRGYEYEVRWENMTSESDSWMTRNQLEEMGFGKLVNEIDAQEAAAMGLLSRPLTAANVEKHLNDFGLETELVTHNLMRGLSGGQKVKVVIGAAMWNNPHIVVLDEPTNYLDRDSLGAMAGAIKTYEGGVIIISHNQEFTKKLCPEVWHVANGEMTMTGNDYKLKKDKKEESSKLSFATQDTVKDALGNDIKVKAPKKAMSRKEQKAAKKLKDARRARGEEVSDDED
eukprot:TRINITY_DN2853_c0_g1_i1.p1 TRINITY_DN2853_c0_g1~~TRINITY_DN2853_c0_g1_i1.p1  ORF type:complete len:1105 (+),score=183.25 TRINITY_DN2853_c0_g1_i1:273-3317(+)